MKKLVLSAIAALFVATMAVPAANATPGAVNKQGCHGKLRHCHPASQLSSFRNGRRYVQFGAG